MYVVGAGLCTLTAALLLDRRGGGGKKREGVKCVGGCGPLV